MGQQPASIAHHPVNPFVATPVMPFQSQVILGEAVITGSAVLDHVGNGLLDDEVVATWWRLSQVALFGVSFVHS
jgi:hypothetical protein